MKKLTATVCALMLLAAGIGYAESANGNYKGYPIVNVVVNGKPVFGDVPGINMDGTTLVPLRVVSESLGGQVEWDAATSTASVTLVAPQATKPPEPTPEQKLYETFLSIYDDIGDYVERLTEIRERIRIAKQFYDIKQNDYYLTKMNDLYWKSFEDDYQAIFTKIGEADQEAQRHGMSTIELMETLKKANDAYIAYKSSCQFLKMYAQQARSELLDGYVTQYSAAYDLELDAAQKVENGAARYKEKLAGAEASR
jgi:hypothetical protein